MLSKQVISDVATSGSQVTAEQIAAVIAQTCPAENYRGKRILLIVPDGTRTAPVGVVFQALHAQIAAVTRRFDVMIALGTHQPMSERAICERLEISEAQRRKTYAQVGFFNHAWNNPAALRKIGTISADEIRSLTGGLFAMDVPVEINKLVFDYDQIVILGPVFPHEVVGFSGGTNIFFPE